MIAGAGRGGRIEHALMCVTNCAYCGGLMGQPARGRRRRYCGSSCRQGAYRRRRSWTVAAMRSAGMGGYVPLKWADYRKPHLWENVSKVEKRARCLMRAYADSVGQVGRYPYGQRRRRPVTSSFFGL
jgi:hypothetical protein